MTNSNFINLLAGLLALGAFNYPKSK